MYNPVDELRAPLPIPNSYGDHPGKEHSLRGKRQLLHDRTLTHRCLPTCDRQMESVKCIEVWLPAQLSFVNFKRFTRVVCVRNCCDVEIRGLRSQSL